MDVAFLAYTYGTNGLRLPAPWSVNLISVPRIRADARRARRFGADVVIVNLHWGIEYVHRPTSEQRRIARALLRPGLVDAVVGEHAHVVQPIRRLQGRFVVYGSGNLVSAQDAACCSAGARDGLLALLHIRVRGGGRASRTSTTCRSTSRGPAMWSCPSGIGARTPAPRQGRDVGGEGASRLLAAHGLGGRANAVRAPLPHEVRG